VAEDFTVHPCGWDADWLGVDADLMPYLGEAEALFALPNTSYDDGVSPPLRIDGECAFLPRLAKWPAFSRRNVAHLLAADIKAQNGPLVWLNATATGFNCHPTAGWLKSAHNR
jgi:hypothetical protein